ncbi:hypothetical protein HPB51_029206 [Rhipicephalus microplus]|uniref:YqaJ viral recombinase domain-containing protein n=1 Tax=Rhipicephalus microplus TaxID=6941 RepID=A0A9J6CV72_RHIMP|nr:hypothetical protein HPB51_029206 [Rhipicephalus microplus]
MDMPMPLRLFDARAEEEKEQQHLEAIHSLVEDLQSLGTSDFAAILLAAGWPSVNSKLGPAPAGSALSYQQAKLPAGFTTWMSPGIMQGAATVTSVPALTLFSDGASQPPLPSSFAAEECRVLTGSMVPKTNIGIPATLQESGLDGLVYDPQKLSCGVWEVKCFHSLRDSAPEEAKKRKFFMVFGENDEPQLDRDYEYYAQVLGHMAVTGCLRGDFVVYSENWIGFERIWFDRNESEDMRKKFDAFFFEHMLPHLARR